MTYESRDDTKDGAAIDRRARRRRWFFLLLPPLTAALFFALSGVSFFEKARRPAPRASFRTPEEVSAEVIARYRKESARLGEIRARRRAGLTLEKVLAFLEKPVKERAYPAVATVLADVVALETRDGELARRLLERSLELIQVEISRREPDERAIEILSALTEHAAFSLRPPLRLDERLRGALTAVLEWSAQAQKLEGARRGPAAALLHVLRLEGEEGSACTLDEIAEGVRDAQLRADLESTARALREKSRKEDAS